MSFPAYPKYKDSGVEWLGQIPDHWSVARAKQLTHRISSGKTPLGGNENYVGSGVLFLRSQNIYDGELRLDDAVFISEEVDASMAVSRVAPGDILLNITGASIGRSCVVPQGFQCANVNQHVCIIRLMDGNLVPYLGWFFVSLISKRQIDLSQNGAARDGLNFQQIGEILIPLPPSEEWALIVDFLTSEISKIDALIEEQERLIDLLDQQRIGYISQLVTSGLVRDVSLIDSGVSWLGKVPGHWKVLPIKRVVDTPVTDGPHETPNFVDAGIPFVSAEAISSGVINFEKIRGYISEVDHLRYSSKYKPKRNDIYLVKSGATTGISAIVDSDIEFNIWSPLAVIRCGSAVLPRFALHFIRSKNFREAIELGWSFGTQQNIGMGVIENLFITIPPVDEQVEIVKALDDFSLKADALISEARKGIALLSERKQSLVAAAVTGKIDVRGWNESVR